MADVFDTTKMRFECPRDFMLECPPLERFAKCIGIHLQEEKVCVRRAGGERCYIICFEDNTSYFKIKNLHYDGNVLYGLELDLFTADGDGAIVTEVFQGIEFYKFANYMKNCADMGFVRPDKSLFKWESTKCELSEVAKRWSKYTDNDPTPGVVPDGITQIRIVSLKYNDEVIAFRFKTNRGSFDMDKHTAAHYGISGVKVDKYITLHNVNGLLVSNSELEKNLCIPDISGNVEDCKKLTSALLKLRND